MDRALIYAVFSAADQKIVGRIRVQKIFYLLEKLGLNGGFRFSYYHYGPYSETLAQEMDFAEILDGAIEEELETTPFGATYSIYKLNPKNAGELPAAVGDIPLEEARRYIKSMKARTSVAIELAATAYWLAREEKVSDWRKELQIRKATKATAQNVSEALALLRDVGLHVE